MRKIALVIMAAAFATMPAYAQGGTTTGATTGVGSWALAAIGLGIAVACAALGQGKVAAAACEGLARNPAARPGMFDAQCHILYVANRSGASTSATASSTP